MSEPSRSAPRPAHLVMALGVGLCVLAPGSATAARDRTPPRIVHEPCASFAAGSPYEVQARFFDDSELFDPKVAYEHAGQWHTVPMLRNEATENFAARIPAGHLGRTLRYFIEVFDIEGNGPARFGSRESPVMVRRADDAPPRACTQVPEESAPLVTTEASREVQRPATEVAAQEPPALTPLAPPEPSANATPSAPCQAVDPAWYCSVPLWLTVAGAALLGAGLVWGASRAGSQTGDSAPAAVVDLEVRAPLRAPAPSGGGRP